MRVPEFMRGLFFGAVCLSWASTAAASPASSATETGVPVSFFKEDASEKDLWWTLPLRLGLGTGLCVTGAAPLAEGFVGLLFGVGVGPFKEQLPAGYASGTTMLAGGAMMALGVRMLLTPGENEGGWGGLYTDRVSVRLHPAFDGATLAIRF